jgi:hypothetical protein
MHDKTAAYRMLPATNSSGYEYDEYSTVSSPLNCCLCRCMLYRNFESGDRALYGSYNYYMVIT